jgi:plasmid stabilization system protein ParE
MAAHSVALSATAERQVRVIVAWLEQNQPDAVSLFTSELAAAVEQLEHLPRLGSAYELSRPGVRRLRLRRSEHHVYYTVNDATRTVVVRAVWHCARGRRPRL